MRWIAKISGVLTTFSLLLIGGVFIGACGTVSFVPPTPTATPTNTPPAPTSPPPPGPGVIELNPADFKPQDSDGDGINEESFLDIHSGVPGLPGQDGGVDLSNYDLEFTFQGGNGKQVQLWYKDKVFRNMFSFPCPIISESIRYNPFKDGRNVNDPGFDFIYISLIGAKVWGEGGVDGLNITSARLIDRRVNPVGQHHCTK